MTRARRLLLGLALLGVLLLALVALGLFPQGPARRLVESRLQATLGPGARIGALSVTPGRMRAEARDVVLDGPSYHVEIDRMRLALSPATLWGPVLDVHSLEIDGARVRLRPAPEDAATTPFASPVLVRDLRISDATLTYQDPALDGDVVLRGLEARGSLGQGALALSVAGGAWARTPPIALGPATARLRVSPLLEVHVEALDAGLARSRLHASGSLGRIWSPDLDLKFQGGVDLAEIEGLAGLAPAGGVVTVEGTVRGKLQALRADARVATEGAQAAGWPVDGGAGQVTYDGAAKGETRAQFDLTLLGGRAHVEARQMGRSVAGRLAASGIDLAALRRQGIVTASGVSGRVGGAASFEGTWPPAGPAEASVRVEAAAQGTGVLASGRPVRVELKATGPIRLGRAGPRLDLDWTAALGSDSAGDGLRNLHLDVRGTARGGLPPAVEGTLDGTLTATGAAGPLPITLAGTFRSAGPKASVTLEARGLGDPVTLSADVRGSAARSLEVRGPGIDLGLIAPQTRGRARVTLTASGPIEELSGAGTVRMEGLVTRGVDVGDVDVTIQARRGLALLGVAAPALALTGQFQGRAARAATVEGTLHLAGTPLAPFAPLLPEGQSLDGRVVGQVDLRVPLDRLEDATAVARLESVEGRSGRLSAASRGPFTLELRDRRLLIRDLALQGPGLTLQAAGNVGLDRASGIDLTAQADVDLTRLPVPVGWTVTGTMHADVALSGGRDRPRATGIVDLAGVSLAAASMPPVTLDDGRMALEGEALAIPGLTARLADGTVTVSGRVPLAAVLAEARHNPARLAPDEEARLHVAWEGVQASALVRQLRPQAPESVEGTLAGEADLSGGLASVAELRGQVHIPATTVRMEDLPLELAAATIQVEDGRVSTDAIVIQTADGSFQLRGRADLVGRRELDLAGTGQLELRALSAFLGEAALTGGAQADVTVRGTLDAPQPQGTLAIKDGTLRLRALPQALTGINGRVVFDRTAIRLEESQASLGGGDVRLTGEARLVGTKVEGARVVMTGRDIALAYPVGMRTRLDADLTLTGGTGAFVLAGTVKATRGLYDLDVALERSLTARVAEATDSPLLRSIALDVRVDTESPVLVRNNLAQLQATGQLAVRGDLQAPAPIGTLEIAQGGKVFLQGREFVIRSGRLTYRGTWDPEIAVTAVSAKQIPDVDRQTGQARQQVEVTVALTGSLENPGIALSSAPAYSERELINLIASGDSQDASTREAIGGQAAALLAGRLSRSLRGLGFDEVSIQPELVARENGVEPGARFTFGKHLSSRVNLVYSLSLQDPESRFIEVDATPRPDVAVSVQRSDAGIFTYGAGQRFRFGGPPRPRPPGDDRVRLTDVRLEGDRPLEPADLVSALATRAGDRRTIWDLQDRAERLRQQLIDRGYLEAEVGARLEGTVAVFHVRSGARYGWRVEGMPDPPDLDAVVRASLFEEDALEKGRARLLVELQRRGHMRAVVATRTERSGDARTLVFAATPGPRIDGVSVRFPGAAALGESELLAAAGGPGRLLTDPEGAARDIVAAYRQRHYLTAQVAAPAVTDTGGAVLITAAVREGPRARTGDVRLRGVTLPEEELRQAAGLQTGAPFEEAQIAAATDRLRGHYFERGYAAARISPTVEPKGDALDVVFQVAEGARRTVGQVVLRGVTRTRQALVRRQVRLRPGRPVDPRDLVSVERRLLDLGIFSRVTVEASDDEPATITVSVEEGDRVVAGYVLRYNDDTHGRADLDGELRNLFGLGLTTGARFGIGRDLRDARGVLSLPSIGPLGRLTASGFHIEEDLPAVVGPDAGTEENVRQQRGGQLQLTRRVGRRWDVLAGYRFKRTRLLPLFPDPIDIAALDLSFLRDTRDSTLDARRGRFWSLSVEYSPSFLGSDFRFVKGFAQVFAMRALTGSVTWAQGARLGLGHGFQGQRLTSTERFRAGGANTIRGFATDSVGPRDAFGDPTGGQAVVVLNEELRYHHRSGLGAVVFYDGGNVFESVSDVSFAWRHAVGAGLRWASPVGLLRLDLGIPVNARPGEKSFRYFISLGQAF